jgi:hypothetical protein
MRSPDKTDAPVRDLNGLQANVGARNGGCSVNVAALRDSVRAVVAHHNHCLPFDRFINSASLMSKANGRGPEMTQSHRQFG